MSTSHPHFVNWQLLALPRLSAALCDPAHSSHHPQLLASWQTTTASGSRWCDYRRAWSETSWHWLLRSNYYATWNSHLEKRGWILLFPNGISIIITQLYKLKWHLRPLYLTLYLEVLLGERKEWHFKKCTEATYYCRVWQSCHLCHSFLLDQLPFFSMSGKSR